MESNKTVSCEDICLQRGAVEKWALSLEKIAAETLCELIHCSTIPQLTLFWKVLSRYKYTKEDHYGLQSCS